MMIIIADDLTGACDTGAAFALRGWATRVAFSPGADFGEAQARVVTTESRALAEVDAVRAVERAVSALGLTAESSIYKKIDSTLRGHPGAELAAMMRAAGIRRALVTPAFPAQGRTVRGGRVYVHGSALDNTQADLPRLFFATGASPVVCRGIALEAVRQGVESVTQMLGEGGEEPLVFAPDAETDVDLGILTQAAQRAGIRLLCGSAGLARALVELLPQGDTRLALEGQVGPALVVAGSYHPVTRRQVEAAGAAGAILVCPTVDDLRIATQEDRDQTSLAPVSSLASFLEPAVSAAEKSITHLNSGNDVVLCVAKIAHLPGAEQVIADGLAAMTAEVLSHARVGGLLLTGGETAAAVCQALGCSAIDLGGEVQPGVVWGRLANGRSAGLAVITKAGGFGDAHTLVEAMRFWKTGP